MSADDQDTLAVFLCYSRAESVVVDALSLALDRLGLKTYFDRRSGDEALEGGILPGEQWKERLGTLIENSDAFIFVISPTSIRSPVCQWELEEASRLQKRIIPIVATSVAHDTLLPKLAELQISIFLDTEVAPRRGHAVTLSDETLARLCGAIRADHAWLREHTRLTSLAQHWARAGHDPSRLLRLGAIADAHSWAARRPHGAPPLPDVLLRFLEASRDREDTDRRHLRRVTGLGFVNPVAHAMARNHYDHAMRLAAHAVQLADDPDFTLIPELKTWAARAAMSSHGLVSAEHDLQVTVVEYSRDGEMFLTGSSDKTIRVWNSRTGTPLATFVGHTIGINAAHFSEDGRFIVSASGDRWAYDGSGARVWSMEHACEVGRVDVVDCICVAAFVGADSSRILTLDLLGQVRIVEVRSGQEELSVETSKMRGDPLRQDSHDPFGMDSAGCAGYVCTDRNGLVIWRLLDNRIVIPRVENATDVVCAAISPCGKWVAGNVGDCIRIWNVSDGSLSATLTTALAVHELTFSANGLRLLGAGLFHRGQTWDVPTWKSVAIIESSIGAETASLHGLRTSAISPDGNTVVFKNSKGEIGLCDVESGNGLIVVTTFSDPSSLPLTHFSPDSRYIAAVEGDICTVYEARTGLLVARLEGHDAPVACLTFAKDSKALLTGAYDRTARIWKIDDLFVPTWASAPVIGTTSRLTWSREGDLLLVVNGNQLCIVSSATWSIVWSREHDLDNIAAAFVSREEVAAISGDGRLQRWSVRSGTAGTPGAIVLDIRKKVVAGGDVRSGLDAPVAADELPLLASFSADGQLVVVCRYLPERVSAFKHGEPPFLAHIFNAMSGEYRGQTPGHGDWITSIAFSRSGNRVATTSGSLYDLSSRVIRWEDATVIADVSTGRECLRIREHSYIVSGCAFAPNDDKIATVSEDGVVAVWNSETGARLATHNSDVPCLTCEFSPTGEWLMTVSRDGDVRFMESASTSLFARLPSLPNKAVDAKFQPAGQAVAVQYADGTAIVWDVSPLSALLENGSVIHAMIARLATGVGRTPPFERADVLMTDAPVDLFISAIQKWPDRVTAFERAAATLGLPAREGRSPDVH